MTIKKLLLAFVAGAMLVGIGAGVTVLEVSRWDTRDHPAYLEKQAVQTVEEIADYDITEFEKINVYATGRPYRFRDEKIIEVVEDKNCKDSFKLVIEYKGKLPYYDVYDWNNQDENGTVTTRLDVVVQPDYNYSLREIREMAQEMFDTKVFYTGNAASLIEKVTVYTAYPEKFDADSH